MVLMIALRYKALIRLVSICSTTLVEMNVVKGVGISLADGEAGAERVATWPLLGSIHVFKK